MKIRYHCANRIYTRSSMLYNFAQSIVVVVQPKDTTLIELWLSNRGVTCRWFTRRVSEHDRSLGVSLDVGISKSASLIRLNIDRSLKRGPNKRAVTRGRTDHYSVKMSTDNEISSVRLVRTSGAVIWWFRMYTYVALVTCACVVDKGTFRSRRRVYVYVDGPYCYRRSSVVCRSGRVSLSVCHSRKPRKKRLNRSRCRLGCGRGWAKGSMY